MKPFTDTCSMKHTTKTARKGKVKMTYSCDKWQTIKYTGSNITYTILFCM